MEEINSIILYVVLGMLICWFYMSATGCGREYMAGEPDFVNNPQIGRDNKPFEFSSVKGVENVETAVGAPENVSPPVNTYNDIIKTYAIDPDIVEAHKNYISNTPHTTTIASSDTDRSDRNDIIPWTGLPRFRQFLPSQENARMVSSETPNQVPLLRRPYCL